MVWQTGEGGSKGNPGGGGNEDEDVGPKLKNFEMIKVMNSTVTTYVQGFKNVCVYEYKYADNKGLMEQAVNPFSSP